MYDDACDDDDDACATCCNSSLSKYGTEKVNYCFVSQRCEPRDYRRLGSAAYRRVGACVQWIKGGGNNCQDQTAMLRDTEELLTNETGSRQ